MAGPGATMPQPGATIDERYRVLSILGEGGMALVYEVLDERTQQRHALKMLVPELARDPEIVARFEREGRASAMLRSPHVVRMMSLEESPGAHPYLVMELLEGRDLEHELESRGRVPVDIAVDWLLQACAALAEAHAAGIVHRDLKPANLFLVEKPEAMVKVLDFGISKVLGAPTKLTKVGAIIGTVLYMSPEQVRGASDVDSRADIWAMGVILWELVAGRPMWKGNAQQIALAISSTDAPPLSSVADVPRDLSEILQAMLERDRTKRPISVEDVARVLAPFARPGLGRTFVDSLAAQSARLRRETVRMAAAPPTPLLAPEAMPPPASRVPLYFGVVIALMGATGAVLIAFWFLRAPTRVTPPAPIGSVARPDGPLPVARPSVSKAPVLAPTPSETSTPSAPGAKRSGESASERLPKPVPSATNAPPRPNNPPFL